MSGRDNEGRPSRARDALIEHLDSCAPCAGLLAYASQRVDGAALRAWADQLVEHLETDLERRRLGVRRDRMLAGAPECPGALGGIVPARCVDAGAGERARGESRQDAGDWAAHVLDAALADRLESGQKTTGDAVAKEDR